MKPAHKTQFSRQFLKEGFVPTPQFAPTYVHTYAMGTSFLPKATAKLSPKLARHKLFPRHKRFRRRKLFCMRKNLFKTGLRRRKLNRF
jgi:hypothetical protein